MRICRRPACAPTQTLTQVVTQVSAPDSTEALNRVSIRRRLNVAVLIASCVFATAAAAQVVPPEPLELFQPEPPMTRMGIAQEGWVVVRFAVLANGSTADVEVIDRLPPQLEDREVIAAVEGWTFKPASANGAPIDWHNNEIVLVFDVEGVPETPSPLYLGAWQEAQDLLQAEDYDKALRSNERAMSSATRLNEIGLSLIQSASIHVRRGDAHAAHAAIVRATDPRIDVLQTQDLIVALQYRNALELQLGDIVAAQQTLERRNAIAPVAAFDPVAENEAAIERALSEGTTLAIQGKILEDNWRHRLHRRAFSIGAVDGDVDVIEVACDRRTAELEYAADAEWALPESWGSCDVSVEGRDDTAFVFYEFQ